MGKKTQTKSTNAEMTARVQTVYGLLIKSYSRFEILQYAAEQWDVSLNALLTFTCSALAS